MSEFPQRDYGKTPRKQDDSAAREHLVAWLRDAHAAKEQSEKMLGKFAGRIENYPDSKSRSSAISKRPAARPGGSRPVWKNTATALRH